MLNNKLEISLCNKIKIESKVLHKNCKKYYQTNTYDTTI